MLVETIGRRWLLLAAAAVLLAVSALSLHTAGAQGANENPNLHQRPLRNGVPVDEFVIEGIGLTTYTQVELYLGAGSGRTPVTYQDFGRAELWFDQRPGGNLQNGGTRFYRLSEVNGVWTVGTQISECGTGLRCSLTKAEWQTLAGQTGASDSATVNPIRVAFNLPSSVTASTIRVGTVHYGGAATRSGSTRWGPSVDWSVISYGAIFVPVDDDDNPLYFRNSRSQEASETTDFQYVFAGGQLSQIRLMAGVSRSTVESSDTNYPFTYGDFESLWLQFEDADTSAAYGTFGNVGFHQQVFRAPDGSPFAPCTDNAGASQCRITRAEWKAAAGTPDASDDETMPPLRMAIKPTLQNAANTDWHGNRLRVRGTLNLDSSSSLTAQNRQAVFTRLSAHISRLQTAYRNADGSWGGVIAPDMNSDVLADKHVAADCKQIHVEAGSDQTDDCSRNVEIGERVSLENILRVGGAADNTGRSAGDWRSNDAWLRADAARPGALYDRIQVQASVGGAPGGGIVFVGSLCPIDAPADPPHPDSVAIIPRDRTAEALATCVYGDPNKGGTYWGGTGPTFIPTVSSGTVTLTLSYHKGADDTSTTMVDESLVAMDTLDIDVALATDNTDEGNGGSDWDESLVIAELGSRSYDSDLVLLIGHRRNRGIPEFWGGLISPTGPGSITGATYGHVGSVALTVPAGGGKLELLGTDKSCEATGEACMLTISRDDLKAAARYGLPAASRGGAIADAAPYYPARLRFTHANPAEDVVISGVLTYPVGGGTREFSYTDKGTSAGQGAAVAAYLPADADARLAPGQSTALAVGFRFPEAGEAGGAWRRFNPTQEFYGIESYRTNVALIAAADQLTRPLLSTERDAYLHLSGPASWTASGGRRLRLDLDGYNYFRCVAAATLTRVNTDTGRVCYVTDAAGNAPSITADADAGEDVTVTANLAFWTLYGAEAPTAADSGSGFFRSTNAHFRQRFESFGTATVRVAAVDQLSSIALGRKPNADNSVPTTPVRIGGSADVRLALLNADGAPTQLSAVSAITVTVIGGGTLSGFGCSSLSSCTIEADVGPLFEQAKTLAGITAAIDLTYKAPASPGTANIEATVVGKDGSTFSERLSLTVSGSATEIATSGEMPRVHSSATADDDRDEIKIPISASDASGNAARMPANAAALVRALDRSVVPASSLTAEVRCTDEQRLNCNVEITVLAAAGSPLDSGAYTATVTGSGIGSTEVGFAVGGPAEKISLAVPATADLPGLAGSFNATASVVDNAGVPVADGTWVTFATTAASSATASAIVTSPSLTDHDGNATTDAVQRARTKNGEAGAIVTIVARGIAILTATVGDKSANEPIDTRAETAAAAAAEQGPPVRFGTSDGAAATGSLATWASSAPGDARAALEQAPGASIVWLWNGVEWIRWGQTAEGAPIPGSTSSPFIILQGDRIWFAD